MDIAISFSSLGISLDLFPVTEWFSILRNSKKPTAGTLTSAIDLHKGHPVNTQYPVI